LFGALESLQADPDTEIMVLLADVRAAEAEFLSRVRTSDKPSVVCFLGSEPRLVWRAGAIPAPRLDEAAMRAAAWVRGWDQALISSKLEERHDELETQAAELRARLTPAQRRLRGLWGSRLLFREAQVVWANLAEARATQDWLEYLPKAAARLDRLADLYHDPQLALVLLELVWDPAAEPDPAGRLLSRLSEGAGSRGQPLIVVRLCGTVVDLAQLARQEARLREAGVVIAASNAEAVQLASLVLQA
jgi:hypothetical protein